MESIALVVVIILFAVLGTWRMERTHKATNLTFEADEALRTMRGVAKKRANRHSIPLEAMADLQDTAPVDLTTGKRIKVEDRRRLNGVHARANTEG